MKRGLLVFLIIMMVIPIFPGAARAYLLDYNHPETWDIHEINYYIRGILKENPNQTILSILQKKNINPNRITLLQLDQLDLTSLPENMFTGLPNLQGINISLNKLESLPENTFQGLDKLKILHLNHNLLTSLHENVFKDLVHLEEINLTWNRLNSLPENLFVGLTHLTKICLISNKLSSLPEGIFRDLTHLNQLYLYDNQLTELPRNIFQNLNQLYMFYLSRNNLKETLEQFILNHPIKKDVILDYYPQGKFT